MLYSWEFLDLVHEVTLYAVRADRQNTRKEQLVMVRTGCTEQYRRGSSLAQHRAVGVDNWRCYYNLLLVQPSVQ